MSHPFVFVNGCFDVLHPGHIKLLEYAAYYGPVYVAINSDASIRLLKGPGRPVYAEQERAMMLRALRDVAGVYIFDEATPEQALQTLLPDIVVVGYDHEVSDPHYVAAEQRGAIVIKAPRFGNYRTSSVLQSIRSEVNVI